MERFDILVNYCYWFNYFNFEWELYIVRVYVILGFFFKVIDIYYIGEIVLKI